MVNGNLAHKLQEAIEKEEIDYTYLPEPLKYTSVSLNEVFNNKLRLEANAFNLEAKIAKEKILANQYGVVNLWSDDGLVSKASYPGRFKRIYVSKKDGKPFFLPSQMTEIKPRATKYISPRTYKTLEGIEIVKNNLLMSRSGTIGKCTISSKTNIGKLYSDDIIRISFNDDYDLGYTYAFFQTSYGQLILQTNNYGAVIKHIEPEHLENIIIPNAPESVKKEIHELVIESYDLRDKSNDLMDKAEQILYKELQLKPIEELKTDYYDNSVELRNYTTKLSDLRLRLDGSFHVPSTQAIIKAINTSAKEVVKIGDKQISEKIILPSRFKRVYVEKHNGIPFFGGKQLLELNPSNIKYLSLDQHANRISEQLFLKENMIAVTCSGTIGKVNIIPKHWENWTLNQHVMRIVPASRDIAGFIFCWLNTELGHQLITRHIYGSVVDEIDDRHLSQVEIPLLKNQHKQQEINDLVLEANELRYQAHLKEQSAIKKMEDIINDVK